MSELKERFNNYWQAELSFENPLKLYQPIIEMMHLGGKRIRPQLAYLGAQLFGNIDNVQDQLALAIELFHNFSLMHDDIMDDAPLRRGKTTIYKQYGINTAILSGDQMLVLAYRYLHKLDCANKNAIIEVFDRTCTRVCEGQQLDMDFEAEENVSETAYLKMIRYKTAELLAAGLQMGALSNGASITAADSVYEMGIQMGLAFQIQDDYIDAYGKVAQTGKQIGGDILQDKHSYLMITAISQADTEQMDALTAARQLIGQAKVDATMSLFDALDVAVLAKEKVSSYTQRAFNVLEELEVNATAKKALEALLNQLIKRAY